MMINALRSRERRLESCYPPASARQPRWCPILGAKRERPGRPRRRGLPGPRPAATARRRGPRPVASRAQRGQTQSSHAGGVRIFRQQGGQQPVFAVGAVVGQGLAGPLAGHQHSPPGIAQVIGVVGHALAPARGQAGPGVLRLDAVPQPVRARGRARLEQQRPGRRGRAGGRCRRGGSRRLAW